MIELDNYFLEFGLFNLVKYLLYQQCLKLPLIAIIDRNGQNAYLGDVQKLM